MSIEQPGVPRIDYHGVRCTEAALMELEGDRLMVSVPRKDIQRIKLRYGIQAPNPTLQIIFGLALTSLGYFPASLFADWIQHGGTFFAATYLVVIVAALGVWTIFEALKRGYFLEVVTTSGTKRLAFAKRPDPAALDDFIATIERTYNIRVDRQTP